MFELYWGNHVMDAINQEHAAKFADDAEPAEVAGGLIYLATPYSHEDTAIRDERFNIACRVAARLMAQGHLIFSPIAHTHPIAMAGELPTDWEFWKRYDHAHLDAAAQVWVLRIDGWDRSKGVAAEIEYAMSKGKPVAYICPMPSDLHPAAPAPELAELRAEVERLTKERDAQKHKYDTLLFHARKERDKWKDGFHRMDRHANAALARAALRELAALREQVAWRPIETAPLDGTKIDLWSPSGVRITDAWWCAKRVAWVHKWLDDFDGIGTVRIEGVIPPTHWQPLPEPPEQLAAIDQPEGS
jgi:nucleoside 2-deoxyribosyltransferase